MKKLTSISLFKYIFIVTCVQLLILISLFGQSTNARFKHIGIADGLPQNTVNCMMQDETGFMWVGTNGGLGRYDGYHFKNFKGAEANGLSNSYINCLEKDGLGNMLVGTEAGLNLYNPRTEQFLTVGNAFDFSVNAIKKDNKGNIWVGSSKGMMLYLPNANKLIPFTIKTKSLKNLNTTEVTTIEEDAQHFIWIGYQFWPQIVKINPANGEEVALPFQKNADKTVNLSGTISIKKDSVGNMWLGTVNHGLYVVKHDYLSVAPVEIQGKSGAAFFERIRGIAFFQHLIWVATRNGLFVVDSTLKVVNRYLSYKYNINSLSNNSICSFTNDYSGNLWIGTYSGGINLLHPTDYNFGYIDDVMANGGLNNKIVYGIVEDKNNNFWIATAGGGLNYYNQKTGVFSYFEIDPSSQSIDKGFIESLCLIGDTLFLGTLKGLYGFNVTTKQSIQIPLNSKKYFSGHTIVPFSLAEDPGNGFWIGSQLGLLHRSKNGNIDYFVNNPNDKTTIARGQITSILPDKNGGLWVGRLNGLSYKKPFSNAFENYDDAKTIKSVSSITTDRNGTIWIGTFENGLIYFDRAHNRFGKIDNEFGLAETSVRSIVEDKTGNFWLGCFDGIAKLSIPDKLPPFEKSDVKVAMYSMKNGLRSNEYLASALMTKKGEIMLAGMNGIVFFNPEKMILNTYRPTVVITDFLIKNIPVFVDSVESPIKVAIPFTKKIILKYDQAYFTFRFSALSFVNPTNNRYAYMMEGLKGDNWHYVGNEQIATYTNLNPGHYIFKVKAANNDGFWNERPTSISITILPPVWMRWYAYVLYAITFIGILWAIYRYYLRQDRLKSDLQFQLILNERDKAFSQQKIDFFTNISHEIKTPLTLILAPLEKLLQTVNANQQIQQSQLLLMQRNGERLMRLIDQLLDFRRFEVGAMVLEAQKGDIVIFIANLLQTFNDYAAKREIKLDFLPAEKNIEAWFDYDKLEKILYNLLSNALKFTPLGGRVSVKVKEIKGMVEIAVEDNGAGIAADHLDKIFDPFQHYNDSGTQINGTGIGLNFTKGLVLLHHGEISVNSRKPTANEEGYTCFKVAFPIGDAHLKPEEKLKGGMRGIFSPKMLPNETGAVIDFDENLTNEAEEIVNGEIEKPIIHIVEDNEEVLSFMASHFAEKFTVQKSPNGKAAWEAVVKSIPDIIISDVMMPEMNGIDFCNLVKNDSRTSHIPIILLTARTADEYKMDGYKTGADDYVTKPFSLKLLEIRVENLLKSRKVLQELFKKDVTLQPKNIAITGPDEQFLQTVMDFIEENIMEPTLTVKELSKAVNMTSITLLRKIKALTDLTVIEFIRSIRLKRAAQLLQKEAYAVSEVCYMIGFTDVDYFRKCFKGQFDMSPKEYSLQYSKPSFGLES